MLLQALADESYETYKQLKEHPYFVEYLAQVSPLRFIPKQISEAAQPNGALLPSYR